MFLQYPSLPIKRHAAEGLADSPEIRKPAIHMLTVFIEACTELATKEILFG
jgi:hypothetical protein